MRYLEYIRRMEYYIKEIQGIIYYKTRIHTHTHIHTQIQID